MADPERFDADPDPIFHPDADPDPDPLKILWIRQNDADPLELALSLLSHYKLCLHILNIKYYYLPPPLKSLSALAQA